MHEFTFKIFSSLSCAALLLLGFTGCEDVFENDLTDQELTVITPPDGLLMQQFGVQFVWDELPDALHYDVQIVAPSFDWVERYVIDTPVVGTNFYIELPPSDYQWRIRAANDNSETEWILASFTVDSVASLATSELVLLSPADGIYDNELAQVFEWAPLAGADDYEFELRDAGGTLIVNPIITEYDTINFTLDEAGYTWGVRGRNGTSNSLFSTRTLSIDITTPGTPALIWPNDLAMLSDTVINFNWSRAVNTEANPSPETDQVYFNLDTTQGSIYNYAGDAMYTDSIGPGTWFWHARTVDEAGNVGAFTNWRTFVLQ
jgi:hypothetical protein